MSDLRKYVQGQDYFLAGSGVTLSATSITLTSMLFPDDATTVTTTDIGSLAYAVIEPETSNAENISFTGITQNANGTATLTGVTRGLRFNDPYTANNDLRLLHSGGSTLRISNTAPFYSEFANKNNDETIAETWTFTNPNVPRLDAQHAYAGGEEEYFATKRYVDGVALSGAPDASTTTKGVTKLSTAPASATNPIAVGDNDTRVPTQGENDALVGDNGTPSSTNTYVTQTGLQRGQEVYAASTTGNDTYVVTLSPVPAALVNGMRVVFKPDTANTAAATLDVNSLGALAIVKNHDQALETGDIEANQIVEVVFNDSATPDVWELQTPGAATMSTANSNTLTGGTSSDADSLHTHLNFTKKIVNVVTPVTIANTVTATTLLTTTITGGTLGTAGAIRGRLNFSNMGFDTSASFELILKYGGTTYLDHVVAFPAAVGEDMAGFYDFTITANGATNSQTAFGQFHLSDNFAQEATAAVLHDEFFNVQSVGATAIDSTANQTLLITGQWAGAAVASTITMHSAIVEQVK